MTTPCKNYIAVPFNSFTLIPLVTLLMLSLFPGSVTAREIGCHVEVKELAPLYSICHWGAWEKIDVKFYLSDDNYRRYECVAQSNRCSSFNYYCIFKELKTIKGYKWFVHGSSSCKTTVELKPGISTNETCDKLYGILGIEKHDKTSFEHWDMEL